MITKQTADYSKLFEKASIALGAKSEDEYITSLNEYFRNIVDLAQIDLQYTILPLDEETFDIDANTREITIPKSFKNGVGVQGDQVAEIIYFSIDRYFDATDLNTQNIYIEWRTIEGDEGVSKEYVRDLTSVKDKIIFGWPLSSEITAVSGTVEFAVRFYTIKEDIKEGSKTIVYSFATKPAKILINKTMNFDITDDSLEVYDAKEMIVSRFQNSEATEEEAAVDAPVFLLDLLEGDNYNLSDVDGHDLVVETFALKTQAMGTGRVTYYLDYAEPDTEDWKGLPYEEPVYILTTDTTRNENKIYYVELPPDESGKSTGYTVFEGDLPTNNTTVYERFGLYYANDAGKYRVRAQNRVGANYANAYSKIMTFPAPVAPQVDTKQIPVILTKLEDGTSTATLTAPVVGELPEGTITYAWANSTGDLNVNANTYLVTDVEDYFTLVVTNTRNTRSKSSGTATFRVTYPATEPVIVSNLAQYATLTDTLRISIDTSKTYDDVIVRWYESNSPATGANPASDRLVSVTSVDGSGVSSFVPDEIGVFYAELVAVYNENNSDPVYSGMCSVT